MGDNFKQIVEDDELARHIQREARFYCPEAVCEIKDYGKRVGLGALDANNEIQEQVFLKKDLRAGTVEIHALLLQQKLDRAQGIDL